MAAALVAASSGASAGDPAVEGKFGPLFQWPVIPLHVSLLPDGRVLGFGGNASGKKSTLTYAVWNPAMGTAPESITALSNTTNTNVFCSGGGLIPSTGDVLIVGGDRKVNNQANYGIADFNIFRLASNLLEHQTQKMANRRWYPSVVTLTDGNQLIMGGRIDRYYAGTDTVPGTAVSYATTPELYTAGQGFTKLTGARNSTVFGGADAQWNYPRAFLGPGGKIFILGFAGSAWWLDPAGAGKITNAKLSWVGTAPRATVPALPTVMLTPGKLLSLEKGGKASIVDMTKNPPVATPTSNLSQMRFWASATVQADGHVFVNGGSTVYNQMTNVAYRSETWNPDTEQWTPGATATRSRLYHSVSMLMPDATILTGGGGAPGPETNPNAEIYYPPYLFKKDGSGTLATRPKITSAPANALQWDQAFNIGVSTGTQVSRVTLTRMSTVTHSYDSEGRFFDLAYTQSGNTVALRTPAGRPEAPPGYYLLFAFDAAGVPSVGRIIRLM
jgi:hypothetical protein